MRLCSPTFIHLCAYPNSAGQKSTRLSGVSTMNSTIGNGFNSPISSISPTFSSSSYTSTSSSTSSNSSLSAPNEHKPSIKSEQTDADKAQLITTATLVFTTRSDPTRASSTPTTVKPAVTAAPVHSPVNLSPNGSPSLSPNASLDHHLDNTLSSLISNLSESSLRPSNHNQPNSQLNGQLNGRLGANGGSTINSAVCKLLKSYTWTVVPKQQKAPPAPAKRKLHVKRPMNACELTAID